MRVDDKEEGRGPGIQVIARAAQILRSIRDLPGGVTAGELSERLGLPRTTIYRIVAALEEEGLVSGGGNSRGRYRLGPEFTKMASAASRNLVALVRPFLQQLSDELSETVDLSVLEAAHVLFVDQVDAPHRLRAASAVGESFPLHTCAPGKAFLAALPASRARELLPAKLVASTAKSITSQKVLMEQLHEIRRTEVAFDYEEQNEGICAVGVAFEMAGQLMAISVPMPAQRFEGRGEECARALRDLRDTILKAELV